MEYELSAPGADAADAPVAVLLHGRGSDEHDLQGLTRLLPRDWTVVTPRAPYPGAPWGYGPGWAWYRYLKEDQIVVDTLEHSLSALDAFLDRLPEVLGREPGPLVLGGFSQGGTTSLAYALRRSGSRGVRAVLNLSGFLEASLDLSAASSAPPVFWGHGLMDPAIPHGLAVRGRARLVDAGGRVTARDYAIGHWIVPEEIDEAAQMVRTAIAPDPPTAPG